MSAIDGLIEWLSVQEAACAFAADREPDTVKADQAWTCASMMLIAREKSIELRDKEMRPVEADE